MNCSSIYIFNSEYRYLYRLFVCIFPSDTDNGKTHLNKKTNLVFKGCKILIFS